jgi:hypothetical protein
MVSSDKVVAEDERERGGVDVVLAESRLLARASASERAMRYDCADRIAVR